MRDKIIPLAMMAAGLMFLLLSQVHFYGGLQPGIQIGRPCGINIGIEIHDNNHFSTYRNGC